MTSASEVHTVLVSRGGEFTWATAGHEFFSLEPSVDPSCPGEVPDERKAERHAPCALVQVTGIWTPVLGQDWEWWNLSVSAPWRMISFQPG